MPPGQNIQNMTVGTMTIQGSQEAYDSILRTQFFSDTDSEIRMWEFGWSRHGSGGSTTVDKPIAFPKDVKTVKMAVTSWTDTELVTLPFEATLKLNGTGLASEVSNIKVSEDFESKSTTDD
jgi:hypothetical protein